MSGHRLGRCPDVLLLALRSAGAPYRGASEPNRCRRRLLETTSTEDSDIAAAAMSGLSSPIAARGIAARLYPNAQPRLVLIVRSVARESARSEERRVGKGGDAAGWR